MKKYSEQNIIEQSQQVADKYYKQIEQKVADWLEDEQLYKTIEQKALPIIEPPVEKFVEQHKDKATQYYENPKLLQQDLEEYFSFTKYIKYIKIIVDSIFVVTSVATILGSLGASIPADIAKFGFKKAFHKLIEKFSLSTVKKLFTKATLRKIKQKGLLEQAKTKSVINKMTKVVAPQTLGLPASFGRAVVETIATTLTLTTTIEMLVSLIKNIGVGAVKKIIQDKGRQFNLPPQLIDKIIKTPETNVETVLVDFKKQAFNQLQQKITTQHGISSLAFLTAANKIKLGLVPKIIYSLGFSHLIEKYTNHPEYSKLIPQQLKQKILDDSGKLKPSIDHLKKLTPNKQESVEPTIEDKQVQRIDQDDQTNRLKTKTEQQEKTSVDQIDLPEKFRLLHSEKLKLAQDKNKYVEMINKLSDQAKNQVNKIATLQFLIENYSKLDNEQKDYLIDTATGGIYHNIEEVTTETESKEPKEGLTIIYNEIINKFKQIGQMLTPGEQMPSEIQQMIRDLSKYYNIEKYKDDLKQRYLQKAAMALDSIKVAVSKIDKKAVLIFDANKEEQPYTMVYRFEKSGKGPYNHIDGWDFDDYNKFMKLHWNSEKRFRLYPPSKLESGFDSKEQSLFDTEKYLSGFDNLESCLNWFTPKQRELLKSNGFNVVKRKAAKVWYGDSTDQVFFEPYEE